MTHSQHSYKRCLLVLRHAKSSWREPGMADFDRPLNHRGRDNAPDMGQKLRDEKISVDIILASTAARVRETLELLLPAWKWQGPITWEKSLYLASPETILKQLAALDDQWHSVMIVGHNPGLSQVAGQLLDKPIDLPTAGLMVLESSDIDWPTAVRSRHWHQREYWKPKEL